jgi:hypothetical protein
MMLFSFHIVLNFVLHSQITYKVGTEGTSPHTYIPIHLQKWKLTFEGGEWLIGGLPADQWEK